MLTDKDKEDLIEAFGKTLDSRRAIGEEIHRMHHDFVQTMLVKEKRKQELIENVKAQVAGWGTLATILAFITGIGMWLKDHLFK
jgi:hypothetical protein